MALKKAWKAFLGLLGLKQPKIIVVDNLSHGWLCSEYYQRYFSFEKC
jgi:hypothetical protein